MKNEPKRALHQGAFSREILPAGGLAVAMGNRADAGCLLAYFRDQGTNSSGVADIGEGDEYVFDTIAADGRERLVALPADGGHQLQLDLVASGAKWLAIVLEAGSSEEKF